MQVFLPDFVDISVEDRLGKKQIPQGRQATQDGYQALTLEEGSSRLLYATDEVI